MGGQIVVDAVHGGLGPAIAWNGTVFGVVWAETSTGTYFRAYDPSGAPTTAIVQINSVAVGSAVDIVANGSNFLVTYADYTNTGATSISTVFQVAQLDATGQALGTPGDFAPPAAQVAGPRFAPAASGFRVWWSDNRSGTYTVYSRAMDVTGAPMGADVAATDGTVDMAFWSATQTPAGYVIGYRSVNNNPITTDLLATDATGAPSGSPVVVGDGELPTVLWNGSRLAVLLGDTFELRDAALAPVGPRFPFATLMPGATPYALLSWTPSRYFAVAGVEDLIDAPVVRVFGDLGCNAPQ